MAVLLIDGLNLIRRIHAGVPDAAKDRDDGVLTACVASARRALRRHHPSHVILVMEGEELSWRSLEYPDYKKNRVGMPEDLRANLPTILSALAGIGVNALSAEGFEADDLIGSIAARTATKGVSVVILSTDKSFCQLVCDHIAVHDHFNDVAHDSFWIRDRFGVEPVQLVDLFSLAGDPSLGLPGIRSVGVHTAARLLHDYGGLDGVIKAAPQIAGKLGEKLRAGLDGIALTRRLVTLRQDVDLGANLHDFRWPPPPTHDTKGGTS